ncbi:MAG TPA: DUF2059 domain-containing protein [Alphaproteobacteria bacterium]|nr:DUF2059 domain-containing protein [Alphaproteobacteria bacterium]
MTMLKLLVAITIALLAGIPGGLAAPAAAQSEATALTTAELMRATALDEVFTQFGAAIEAAPREQAVPFNAAMHGAWVEAAREIFAADRMHGDLALALEDKFTTGDVATYAAFYAAPFGRRVTERERAIVALDPAAQLAARDVGAELAEAAPPERQGQVDEMLKLVSADISTQMVRESVRGMLIGMSVTGQRGDITVPWEEIDAQLEALMPGLEAEVAQTQRAMMFFAYRDFTDAELDEYLAFLRTEAAQKFYAIAAYAIGEIIAERMHAFGEALAAKLGRVNI